MIHPVSIQDAIAEGIRRARVESIIGRETSARRQRARSGRDMSAERERAAMDSVDAHVRAHEEAHLAVLGSDASGGAVYSYANGYAVGGSVKVDLSPVPGDPEATIKKAERIRTAALAPGDPSAADMRVAAAAYAMEMAARREASASKGEEGNRLQPLMA